MPPWPGSAGQNRHRKWCRFSSYVGAANWATRTCRGSRWSTNRLIAPPLPEASHPSKTTHSPGPSCGRCPAAASCPPSTRRSCSRRCCAALSCFASCSLLSRALRSTAARCDIRPASPDPAVPLRHPAARRPRSAATPEAQLLRQFDHHLPHVGPALEHVEQSIEGALDAGADRLPVADLLLAQQAGDVPAEQRLPLGVIAHDEALDPELAGDDLEQVVRPRLPLVVGRDHAAGGDPPEGIEVGDSCP